MGVDARDRVRVCVGECVCSGTWMGVRGVCIGSYEGVLRLNIMLQSDSLGGEAIWGCSLSEGGWMDIQGGLIFFFLWPPPTDCTLTGNAGPDRGVKSRSSPVMTACGRQTSMEWRRWSSG